jgi:hypothetical protein
MMITEICLLGGAKQLIKLIRVLKHLLSYNEDKALNGRIISFTIGCQTPMLFDITCIKY